MAASGKGVIVNSRGGSQSDMNKLSIEVSIRGLLGAGWGILPASLFYVNNPIKLGLFSLLDIYLTK